MARFHEAESHVCRAGGQFILADDDLESQARGFLNGTIAFGEEVAGAPSIGPMRFFVYWETRKFVLLGATGQPVVWLMSVDVGENRDQVGLLVDVEARELWHQMMFLIQDYARGNPIFLLNEEEARAKVRAFGNVPGSGDTL